MFRLVLKKRAIYIFGIILIADALFTLEDKKDYLLYSQLLMMPFLALYILLNSKSKKHPITWRLMMAALAFSFLGDLFLGFKSQIPNSTLYAGIVYLITLVIYIYSFKRFAGSDFKKSKNLSGFNAGAVMVVFFIGFYAYFKKSIGMDELQLPILIYMIAFVFMAVMVTNMLHSKSNINIATNFFIPGAILLLSSAIVVSFELLVDDEPYLKCFAVLSYGVAQALIASGVLKVLKS